ncbi:MAG: 30S ribosomal protein S17e [Nanoarchaeota archaeon]|nr:30S ribosomal protein S17e [Nanoarchaeota archaeon]
MGRVKTTIIKSKGQKLFKMHSDKFTNDYKKNKEVLKELTYIPSKKIRNILAGYVTRLKKTTKDWEVS